MSELSRRARKQFLYQRAKGCCEYCQTAHSNTAQPMHEEHIDPDGGDDLENLCLSCARCNLRKGIAMTAIDPETNQVAAMFNPRTQSWNDHFSWSDDTLYIVGLTATGRVTIARLQMNDPVVVNARRIWRLAGAHPPG